jgi:hypothetical protein
LVSVFIAEGISVSSFDVFHKHGARRRAIRFSELPSTDAIISSEVKEIAHRRQILGLEAGDLRGDGFDEAWGGHGVEWTVRLWLGQSEERGLRQALPAKTLRGKQATW